MIHSLEKIILGTGPFQMVIVSSAIAVLLITLVQDFLESKMAQLFSYLTYCA